MARRPHPKPEVEAALRYAEFEGWRIEPGGSHAWGKMYCPYNDDDCRSNALLREWLLSKRPPEVSWYTGPSPEAGGAAAKPVSRTPLTTSYIVNRPPIM